MLNFRVPEFSQIRTTSGLKFSQIRTTLGFGEIFPHHLPTASLKSSRALSSMFSEELWRGKWWTELYWDQCRLHLLGSHINGITYWQDHILMRVWGGRSATSALTVSKCENFDLFFHWNSILWHSKHILSHCVGSKECHFHTLFWLSKWGACLLQMIIQRAAAVRGGIGDFSICMDIDFLLCKIRSRIHIIII